MKMQVERLFRLKKLKVVIATGTLAQGVNMPCRSIIIEGHSNYITPVTFRQMCGRAGRRGYDTKGRVIFHHIKPNTVLRMLSMDLPTLSGHMPLTTSLTLRLAVMSECSSDIAKRAAKRLLVHPFFCLAKQAHAEQVKHHLRFSLEFLMRNGYIDPITGGAQGFSGLVTHLYYEEPGQFLLADFLKKGLFHDLCTTVPDGSTRRKLIFSVLATLFMRREVPWKTDTVMPDLPAEFMVAIKEYNQKVLDMYTNYVVSYATKMGLKHEHVLPMSSISFARKTCEFGPLVDALQLHTINFCARSVFTANSGFGDSFKTPHEIQHLVHSNIFLDSSVIPMFPLVIASARMLSPSTGKIFLAPSSSKLKGDHLISTHLCSML